MSSAIPNALLRQALTANGLPGWGTKKQMWERLKYGGNQKILKSLCRKRGLPTSGSICDLKHRVFALFGKIMRKYFYGILFCKYAKDGIRRELAMHAMLKRLPIPDLRAKIYVEAKVIHAKPSKEDMIAALWRAMPVIGLPVLLTPEQQRLSYCRFEMQHPNLLLDNMYLYRHYKVIAFALDDAGPPAS